MHETLSPALAWVAASLTIPEQYAAIMQQSIVRVNQQCKSTVIAIDK